MKRSTKIITTAIALALVVAAMVVGIYAATSAAASITAQVSWTATAGIEFSLKGAVLGSKEFYEYNNYNYEASNPDSQLQFIYGEQGSFNSVEEKSLCSVNTTTSNTAASGLTNTLNATFYDPTDDGVNNPSKICYNYQFEDNSAERYEGAENWCEGTGLNIRITKIPQSTANIKVTYGVYVGYGWNSTACDAGPILTAPPTAIQIPAEIRESEYGGDGNWGPYATLQICLEILTPDTSISNFDAGLSFTITKAS